MKMLKMCLNPKVIAGLAVVGFGIFVYAPEWFAAALPILFLAICPLSMVLMMKMMMPGSDKDEKDEATQHGVMQASSDEELQGQLRSLQAQQTALADQLEARRRQEASQS